MELKTRKKQNQPKEEKNKKLGIIVPYRNRFDQLQEFKREMKKYMSRKKIPYEIFVIEQDDAKLFNRGMLLNIGYTYAKKAHCDYVVFHDIDMLPFRVDYSYTEVPVHMATRFRNMDRTVFDEYFGGVTMFPIDVFEKINGYSNKYWGWGYEDTDLLYRCINNDVELETIKIKNQDSSLQKLNFNGYNAYVRGLNNFNIHKPITFFISFKPNELTCDPESYSDDFNIFTIPGYDFSISFNSYSRYNICLFNDKKEALYVNSNITKDYYTNIAIVIDEPNQEIKVYQDGYILDTITNFGKLFNYQEEKYFYIGMGNPLSGGSKKYFKGLFDKLVVVDGALNESEIINLTKNKHQKNTLLHYDTNMIVDYELVDLSGNKNYGHIFNCEITEEEIKKYREVKIPYRRDSIFNCLLHEENGFVNNGWKDQSTRWNQLRFYNEVCKNKELVFNEGLTTLEFVEHGVVDEEENIKIVKVGI
jgi:hypothetical protein